MKPYRFQQRPRTPARAARGARASSAAGAAFNARRGTTNARHRKSRCATGRPWRQRRARRGWSSSPAKRAAAAARRRSGGGGACARTVQHVARVFAFICHSLSEGRSRCEGVRPPLRSPLRTSKRTPSCGGRLLRADGLRSLALSLSAFLHFFATLSRARAARRSWRGAPRGETPWCAGREAPCKAGGGGGGEACGTVRSAGQRAFAPRGCVFVPPRRACCCCSAHL